MTTWRSWAPPSSAGPAPSCSPTRRSGSPAPPAISTTATRCRSAASPCAPCSTGYADLRRSIMEVLLELPPETVVRPGHTDPTTVADELESNRFVRIWRGLDPEGSEPCTALGEPATLILLGDDYDGGHKAWVRWPDGRDDIVPGSKVSR